MPDADLDPAADANRPLRAGARAVDVSAGRDQGKQVDHFKANLQMLQLRDADLASRLRALQSEQEATPNQTHPTWDWEASPQGPTASIVDGAGKRMALCSKYRPLDEAERRLEAIDPGETPTVVVLGYGAGHTVLAAARRLKAQGLLVVYEPDERRLLEALKGYDQRPWLVHPNLALVTGPADQAAVTAAIERYAAIVTQGTKLIIDPAVRRLDGEALNTFSEVFTKTVALCRTTIATTLVNGARTHRNLARNLAAYAAGPNISELQNAASGKPAVCVSAGPSLVKNIDLLSDPAHRDSVVLITVQTALKPLLDRGIRPDFVTALDYSEICRRFYESLPDLPETTLVVEPKAHPVILDSYPGPIRVLQNDFSELLLGGSENPLCPAIPKIRAGATVAHLSLYLAQYLGCDPIMMIGQDLGFSDGLYYCPGTAAHDVWSAELNPFCTVENYEWERIARHQGNLSRHTDVHGRPIFSDEQMVTYLRQFERDFAESTQRIVDCTEGGMTKDHAEQMPFGEALKAFACGPVPRLSIPAPYAAGGLDPAKAQATGRLLAERRGQVRDVRRAAEASLPILAQMKAHHQDTDRMNQLHARLTTQRKRAEGELKSALNLITQLNAIGAYRRMRHDLKINLLEGDQHGRMLAQIDRDIDNLEWMIQACDEAIDILDEAVDQAAIVVNAIPEKRRSAACA